MSKIVEILMLIVIGGVQAIGLAISWLASMIVLLFSEIVGTKKFVTKFHKLNKIVIDEFEDIMKVFRKLYLEVK